MKQSKRLLCVLLSMIMILSCVTVGVSAYKTDYSEPYGYTNVNKPYFTVDQASTAMLDFLDDILADVDVDEEIVGITIRIKSIDTTFQSLKNIFESTLYKIGKIFDLGDIEKLNVSIPKNGSIRRTNASLSDTDMLKYVLEWVSANASPLYKIADNSLDLGLIDNFWSMKDEVPILNDLHGYLNEMLYGLLIEDIDFEDANNATLKSQVDAMTLDDILQDFINNRCLNLICDGSANDDGTNDIADFLGLPTKADGTLAESMGILDLCPSLKASDISITTTSTYDLIKNLFKALIDDVVVKFAGDLILDALEIAPDDPEGDTSYINIAITLFATPQTLGLPEDASESEVISTFLAQQGVENPDHPKPIDKTNAALKYILKEGITQYVYFKQVDDNDESKGKYLHIDDEFMSKLAEYIKSLLPTISTLISDFPSLTAEQSAALSEMNDQQTFAFLAKFLLENFVDGVEFSENCDSIRELATYTLVEVAKDLAPNIDFEDKIAKGEIDPERDCLEVAAVVIRYYFVGEFGMEIPENVSFADLLNYAFDFFLTKYSTLFNIYPNDAARQTYGKNVWYKVYRSAGEWIRLTSLFYGVDDSYSGLEDLIMNKIIGNVLDFDLNGLVSIIGVRPASSNPELAKPFSKLVVNLLGRVLNSVFRLSSENDSNKTSNTDQLNLIIPYSYTTLDQFTKNVNKGGVNEGTGLKNTVKMLLTYIPNISGPGSLLGESLDLIVELIGIIDTDDFSYVNVDYRNNNVGLTYSIASLKQLVKDLSIDPVEGAKYYEDSYRYFRMVDFAPWAYLEFKRELRNAEGLVEQYDNAKNNPEKYEYPAKTEITRQYYVLNKEHEIIESNKAQTSTYQLQKAYDQVTGMNITNPGGTTYSIRSWNAYTNAMNFANKVFADYAKCAGVGYRQSKINMARKMLIEAANNLKPYTGLANYETLDEEIERVLGIDSPERYTKSSINELIQAYKDAFYLDRDYGSDEQGIVTHAFDKLSEARSNLKAETYIELFDSTAQHIDEVDKFIYGLGENYYTDEDKEMFGDDFSGYFSSMNGYVMPGDDIDTDTMMNFAPSENGNGTGAKIQISVPHGDGERKIKEYTVVVFGDVTGDGHIDGTDAVIMKTYATLMVEQEFSAKCIISAGDLNFDGNIGGSDVTTVTNCGLGKATVEQCPEQVFSQVRTFADVLAEQ